MSTTNCTAGGEHPGRPEEVRTNSFVPSLPKGKKRLNAKSSKLVISLKDEGEHSPRVTALHAPDKTWKLVFPSFSHSSTTNENTDTGSHPSFNSVSSLPAGQLLSNVESFPPLGDASDLHKSTEVIANGIHEDDSGTHLDLNAQSEDFSTTNGYGANGHIPEEGDSDFVCTAREPIEPLETDPSLPHDSPISLETCQSSNTNSAIGEEEVSTQETQRTEPELPSVRYPTHYHIDYCLFCLTHGIAING